MVNVVSAVRELTEVIVANVVSEASEVIVAAVVVAEAAGEAEEEGPRVVEDLEKEKRIWKSHQPQKKPKWMREKRIIGMVSLNSYFYFSNSLPLACTGWVQSTIMLIPLSILTLSSVLRLINSATSEKYSGAENRTWVRSENAIHCAAPPPQF